MVARLAGGSLGLFAFVVALVAGLVAHNPATLILSRGILAMFVFCLIGFVLGTAAELVVTEHEGKRKKEIEEQYRDPAGDRKESVEDSSTGEDSVEAAQVA